MKLKNIITIAAFGLTSLWCAAQSNVIEEVALRFQFVNPVQKKCHQANARVNTE